MSRGVLFAVVAVVLLGGAAYVLHRPQPVEPEETTSAAPRIIPKENKPVPTRATPVPEARKTPKKTAPEPPAPPPPPPAPTLASLRIETDVPGASVFIDRQFVGNTPLSLDKLEPGTKRVQVTATGFDSVTKTVDLNPGPNTVTIRVREVSLSANANVVHKHGMGSCEGRLSASLDGIRYDTAHKNDAFALRYEQIETLAVDYLQKNLRVKQKGGKTWNFTNQNADVLLVFHRDVEAARRKLADGYARAQ
jgi:hypothetical protein